MIAYSTPAVAQERPADMILHSGRVWTGDEANPWAEAVAIRDALGSLPPEQREVVILKVWHGLTFAEIGAALDIPDNTAASRYRYALQKLRRELGDE